MKKFLHRKSKRKLAKVSAYLYGSAEVGHHIDIKSTVQLYEDQLDKIYEVIIEEVPRHTKAYLVAEKIVKAIGEPINVAEFEYDGIYIHIQLKVGID